MKKNMHVISRVLPGSIGEELELNQGMYWYPLTASWWRMFLIIDI